jgi:hypothetical protein
MLFFEYTKKSKENKFHQESLRIFRTRPLYSPLTLSRVVFAHYGCGCIVASVVDRHRFDADPDPNFHVDADPDPDWQFSVNMMPILMRILP